MSNIVLTGFMGTGKTTTGRLLAARLGYAFLDTDELIAQRTGKAVADIFATDGASRFRQLENEIAAELAAVDNTVIATGGRLMLDPQNLNVLAPGNLVLTLHATPDEILRRLSRDGVRRPLLEVPQPRQRVTQLLKKRAEGYGQFPQIPTANRNAAQVADHIIHSYNLQRLAVTPVEPHRLVVTHPQGSYEVLVGSGLLGRLRELAPLQENALAVISDHYVSSLFADDLPESTCQAYFAPGEEHKTLETVRGLYDHLLAAGVDRSAAIVALGGGVVGDVAGFVAATYMRGVPFVQCPTTLLAMVDASVGGKTGVDLPQGKNLIGAFKQPLAVVADIDTLRTLPPAEFAAGMAEVVKHALLAGGELRELLETTDMRQEMLFQNDNKRLLQDLLIAAIAVKRDVVQRDPYETGLRATLNLGHTFAHAIERVSEYQIGHGYAVAMGLVCAARLSATLGYGPPSLQEYTEHLLKKFYLPVRIPRHLTARELLEAMSSDKKKKAGKLRYILMRDVGNAFVATGVPSDAVLQTIQELSAP